MSNILFFMLTKPSLWIIAFTFLTSVGFQWTTDTQSLISNIGILLAELFGIIFR